MKKLIIIIVMLFVGNSYGQNIKTTVFTLNLDTLTKNALQSSDCVKRLVIPARNPLAFKLENGNPYKYRYEINSKEVSFFGDAKVNYMDSIPKVIIPKKNLETTQVTDTLNEIKKLESERDSLIAKNKSLTSSGLISLSIKEKIRQNQEISQNEERIKTIDDKIRINNLSNLISIYKSKAPNAYNIIIENKTDAINLFIREIVTKNSDDDKTNISNAFKLIKKMTTDLKSDINKYTFEISSEDFLNRDTLVNKRTKFNSTYIKFLNEISKLNNDVMNFDDIKEDYVKNLNEFNTLSSEIKQEISKMFQLKLYNYLLPVDINGKNIDLVEVSVVRHEKTATNPTPVEYTYNIYVKGGFKIDISGGLFITSIKDKEYETKDILVDVNGTNQTQKIIYEQNKGNYDFGFGSMINVSIRGGSWVRPTFNVGALFTANQKFQILSGLGIILGKEERIILHAGLSMGSVAEISNQFVADGNTSYNLGTSGQVSTVDKFKFGHFFGLTYNLGKTKTQIKN